MSSRLPVKCSVEKNESHDSSVRRKASIFAWWSSKNSGCFLDYIPLIRTTGHSNDSLLITVYTYYLIAFGMQARRP